MNHQLCPISYRILFAFNLNSYYNYIVIIYYTNSPLLVLFGGYMRSDGILVKNADPIYTIVPYVISKRYDSMNMITLEIPAEPMQKYIKKLRDEGKNISYMSILIAAYIRTVLEFPKLNRFIKNKRIYDRNEFCISLVVLKDDYETMSKIYFDLKDTILTVRDKVEQYISQNRSGENSNETDQLIKALIRFPVLLNITFFMYKFLDQFGWLPKKLIDSSPFHASLLFSNLASIRTNHIYHHVYEFGTTSIAITMGNMHEVPMRVKKEVKMKRCIPLGIVMDERICSGKYFSQAYRRFLIYLSNPALLEDTPIK